MGKSFVGYREERGGVSVKWWNGKVHLPLDLCLDLWSHSPSGFEWGYAGSGPAQLALAILANVTGRPALALDLHQAFKADVVLFLPKKHWCLHEREVVAWVLREVERKLGLVDEIRLAKETPHA